MSQPTYGRIMNYRKGIRTQASHECLVQFNDNALEAQTGGIIGRRVLWKNGKTALYGKVAGFHGRNGIVIVRFKKGVPGQAIGAAVQLDC